MAREVDMKASSGFAGYDATRNDPVRLELEHRSRLEVEGKPFVRTGQNSTPLVASFNTSVEAYGRPYDAMARLDGAHLRVRSNSEATRALLNVKPGHPTTNVGIRQRVELAVELNHVQSKPGGSAFGESVAALFSPDFAARLASALAAGSRAAFVPATYDAIHMVDVANAKRATARLGALADDPAAARKVLGEGWTITRTSSAKIGMSGSGPLSGGDAAGYESTWAFAVRSPSGLGFGVRVGIEERRYAGEPESRGEIRTSTIGGGRLFSLAEKLIRYASEK